MRRQQHFGKKPAEPVFSLLPLRLKKRLEKIAEREGKSMSRLIREILEEWVEKRSS
jgi:predicted DNA-binding protein